MPQLALGTAQFGLRYGITNAGGKVAPSLACTLLKQANEAGVAFIDTAQAYGNAEQVLGESLPSCHSFEDQQASRNLLISHLMQRLRFVGSAPSS